MNIGEPHWGPGDRVIYFKTVDASGMAGIRAVPAEGGRIRQLVRLDDPRRSSNRQDLAGDGRAFYFTLEDRQSDIWIAETSAQ